MCYKWAVGVRCSPSLSERVNHRLHGNGKQCLGASTSRKRHLNSAKKKKIRNFYLICCRKLWNVSQTKREQYQPMGAIEVVSLLVDWLLRECVCVSNVSIIYRLHIMMRTPLLWSWSWWLWLFSIWRQTPATELCQQQQFQFILVESMPAWLLALSLT